MGSPVRSAVLLSALTMLAPAGAVTMAMAPPEGGRFGLLSDEECWRRMPTTAKGGGQPLPSWALALADPMPRTAAALLPLDFAHRMRGPLDPKLRARLRWVAAHADHCDYAEAVAAFDARRAGLDDRELEALRRGDDSRTTPGERAALAFARKMIVDSAGITDDEFAALVREYGEERTAAMVLLLAYSGFQDRLLLCLGVPPEAGGPKPPLDVVFARGAWRPRPVDPVAPFLPAVGRSRIEADPEWGSLTYEQIQAQLEGQRRRRARLRIPGWEEVRRGLPEGFIRPNQVAWNLVHLGYVPELAVPWEVLMRANAPETYSHLNRNVGVDLFWVTARTIDCSYCMGHGEMLWELVGLDRSRADRVCRALAGGDWSSFPHEEQRALAFARKVTRAPWSVTDEDIQTLRQDFGPAGAAAVIYWVCRGNYMTRVANGFQLPLERDNVLRDYILGPASRGNAVKDGSGPESAGRP